MTNKEKYQKAFSTLHASGNMILEDHMMEKNKNGYRMKKAVAACVAAVVVFGSMTVAYAADLGGIRQKITVWFHGEQAQFDVTGDGAGSYSYSYTDENGETHKGSGGGVAIDDSGNETPLSAEDVLDDLSNSVEADADGNVFIYYYDKKIEITDLFDADGVCKVAFDYDGKTVYFQIEEGKEIEGMNGNYSYGSGTQVPEDVENYTMVE